MGYRKLVENIETYSLLSGGQLLQVPDGDLIVAWQVDESLCRQEAIDLALGAELGGEGGGEDLYLGEGVGDLTRCL